MTTFVLALAFVPIAVLGAVGRHYEVKAVRLANAIIRREFEVVERFTAARWYSFMIARFMRFLVSTPLLGFFALRARYPRQRRALVAFMALKMLQQRGLCITHLIDTERALERWIDYYGERKAGDDVVGLAD